MLKPPPKGPAKTGIRASCTRRGRQRGAPLELSIMISVKRREGLEFSPDQRFSIGLGHGDYFGKLLLTADRDGEFAGFILQKKGMKIRVGTVDGLPKDPQKTTECYAEETDEGLEISLPDWFGGESPLPVPAAPTPPHQPSKAPIVAPVTHDVTAQLMGDPPPERSAAKQSGTVSE